MYYSYVSLWLDNIVTGHGHCDPSSVIKCAWNVTFTTRCNKRGNSISVVCRWLILFVVCICMTFEMSSDSCVLTPTGTLVYDNDQARAWTQQTQTYSTLPRSQRGSAGQLQHISGRLFRGVFSSSVSQSVRSPPVMVLQSSPADSLFLSFSPLWCSLSLPLCVYESIYTPLFFRGGVSSGFLHFGPAHLKVMNSPVGNHLILWLRKTESDLQLMPDCWTLTITASFNMCVCSVSLH